MPLLRVARAQTSDYNAKVGLLQAAFRHLARDLWEEGDGDRFRWVWTELDALDRELNTLSKEELARRLRFLYKRLAYAKGRWGNRNGLSATLAASTNPNYNADANSTAKGENEMSIYVDVPKEVLVGRGEHPARIVAVGQPETSKFDESKQSIKLVFEITAGKFKSERLTKYYALNLSSKASLGQLCRRLCGELEPGERFDLERLLDHEVSIIVTHKVGDDGEYAAIQDVFALEEVGSGV